MLAKDVCALHLVVRRFDDLRSGTLARLYDEWFRRTDYPVELFALAIAADSAGRLGSQHEGSVICRQAAARIEWLRRTAATVDAGELRERYPSDIDAFRRALHEARAKAIKAARPTCPGATCPEGEGQQ
jgi:hypothetical protein